MTTTTYWQETDSKIFFPEQARSYQIYIADETFGEKPFLSFFSSTESRLIRPALEAIKAAPKQEILNEAKRFLFLLQETVSSLHQLNFDLSFVQPIRAFVSEDNTILLEWIFKNYRIGFSIEENSNDSGWYLVSKRELGEISASGYLHPDTKNTILWLVNFVISHS